jgi:DNA mismatch endonuclease (patch repair protein)
MRLSRSNYSESSRSPDNDPVDPARSRNMSRIRAKDTKPELVIRRGLHRRGFRFRLHSRKLPGKPDLILRKYNAVVFVHGCFWHRHECAIFKWPKRRSEFWAEKLQTNVRRDAQVAHALSATGWRVLNIWECALKGPHRIGIDEVLDLASEWLQSNEPIGHISGLDSQRR